MKKLRVLFPLGLLGAGVLVAACASPPEIEPAVLAPVRLAATPAAEVAALPARPEAFGYPMPAAMQALQVDSSNCIACHSDAERLQELAVEPVKVELSSGEG